MPLRLRRSKPDVVPVSGGNLGETKFSFVEINHPSMLVARTVEEQVALGESDVKGAYVKVQPSVRASDRHSLDTKAVRDKLLKRGAIAVVVAPVIIPDARVAITKPRKNTRPQAYLEEYFEATSAAKKVVKRALEEALASADEAGL